VSTNRSLARADVKLVEPNSGGARGSVALHYVARAGLLPELSRQTYDSFPKALREAVLNALDADATRVDIDFSRIESDRELDVLDDGSGMTMRDFCEQFMSLGGSSKFGNDDRFGRIGIGSLALLQYAEAAIIETKCAGSATGTRAHIQHPWNLGGHERRAHLNEMAAGTAEEFTYDGDADDHFTRIRLENVNAEVWTIGQDPTAFYQLLESLRRILPLPWSDGPLAQAIGGVSPTLHDTLRQHVESWSTPVYAHSVWERDVKLHRRTFGDDGAGMEDWTGQPVPLLKKLRVPGDGRRREITLAGFLLSQKRARADWFGLTARVQNVAVEEHTFFDVASDPGFRKYITGEIWLLGEIDRERLINIDRSSFNRECADYQAVQRVMSRTIVEFKAQNVQRPQRQKVAIRRVLDEHIRALRGIERVARRAVEVLDAAGARGLPASEPSRGSLRKRQSVIDMLTQAGAEVVVDNDRDPLDLSYKLDMSGDGERVAAIVGSGIVEPHIHIGGLVYRIEYAVAESDEPPLVIRNRPRQIVFNTAHPMHASSDRPGKYEMSLALELAYLLDSSDAASVYEQMMSFLEAL
jgi:Histidine kinase-, DNA gyrase B-, and HSP90-like ATPase